jgi:heme-degrading monooxygenase HmoA
MKDVVVTIFRSRLRPEALEEYGPWAERMETLAAAMPGFRSIKTYSRPGGERVSIIEFESEETLAAWREHPEHLEAQRLGRERFYEEFELMTCVPLRAWGFKRKG